jgi:hypothetical protein
MMKVRKDGIVREVRRMQAQTISLRGAEPYSVHLETAERLQSEAWSAFNSAFHAPEAEEYRRAGRELYQRVLEERIKALYQRGDEQNYLLDAHISA